MLLNLSRDSMKIAIVLVVAVFLSLLIFLEKSYGVLAEKINSTISIKVSDEILDIVYPSKFPTLSPLSFNSVNRSILSNVYESLVKFDPYLTLKPALAKRWGLLDDGITWDFDLRSDLFFSNGDKFSSKDVVQVYEDIKQSNQSDLKAFLSTIDRIEIVDDFKLKFILKQKDPFFLSKISTMLIFHEIDGQSYGTGPYMIKKVSEDDVNLINNPYYSRSKLYYNAINFQALESPEQRVRSLENKKSDIVVDLPSSYPDSLISDSKIEIIKFPALETYFLGFDTVDSVFKDLNLIKSVHFAIDTLQIEVLGGGGVETANQFASNGIFGFNPDIKGLSQDLQKSQESFASVASFNRLNVQLDLPYGFEALGEYIKDELYNIGFDIKLNFLESSDLLLKIAKGDTDFYLIGWKHELADINDFLINMVHSRVGDYGAYNASLYINKKIDKLIEKAQNTVGDKERQEIMQQIMYEIVEINPFGVPLFNTELIYGIQPYIKFQPRFDGYMVGDEIENVL